jgi:hypothetical protein
MAEIFTVTAPVLESARDAVFNVNRYWKRAAGTGFFRGNFKSGEDCGRAKKRARRVMSEKPTRRPRGTTSLRQREVARYLRSFRVAGVPIGKVVLDAAAGTITVHTAGPDNTAQQEGNEWDAI